MNYVYKMLKSKGDNLKYDKTIQLKTHTKFGFTMMSLGYKQVDTLNTLIK